jgi:hypothetical protein
MNISANNLSDLGHLADEFSFEGLQREVSIRSLSTHLESQFRHFIFQATEGLSRLDRLILHGFDESSSRKMLVLTGGNFSTALSALEQLRARLKFASSVPIHMCPDTFEAVTLLGRVRPVAGKMNFLRDGDKIYSFTADDHLDYNGMANGIVQIGKDLLARINCTGPFLSAQWTENADNEAVFIMMGISAAAARKLMKLARGRYCLAWAYFNTLGRANLTHVLETGVLFSEMKNMEAVGRECCREFKGLTAVLGVLGNFVAVQVLRDDRGGPDIIFGCQDVREFVQRNRDVLQGLDRQ